VLELVILCAFVVLIS